MQLPAITLSRVAVITGAASGTGLAAAEYFASLGLRLCLVDADTLAAAMAALPDWT